MDIEILQYWVMLAAMFSQQTCTSFSVRTLIPGQKYYTSDDWWM